MCDLRITQIRGFIELESHHRPGVGGFSQERVKRSRVAEQSRRKTWKPSVPYFLIFQASPNHSRTITYFSKGQNNSASNWRDLLGG